MLSDRKNYSVFCLKNIFKSGYKHCIADINTSVDLIGYSNIGFVVAGLMCLYMQYPHSNIPLDNASWRVSLTRTICLAPKLHIREAFCSNLEREAICVLLDPSVGDSIIQMSQTCIRGAQIGVASKLGSIFFFFCSGAEWFPPYVFHFPFLTQNVYQFTCNDQ